MKTLKNITLAALFPALLFVSCKPHSEDTNDNNAAIKTPVNITTPERGTIADRFTLNATSSYLTKDIIRANADGYIKMANVSVGDRVSKGEVLFVIKTKEAEAIGNIPTDTSLSFKGIEIRAEKNGIIDSLIHTKGDYVQDGDQLCLISNHKNLVFLLDVPFELHKYVSLKKACKLSLSDGDTVNAIIDGKLPAMDMHSQTERYIIRPLSKLNIPENLIAEVVINKRIDKNALLLPKSALLTDETQSEYWIMKLINDTTAVKVKVKKGIESGDKVEILSPAFSSADRILITGNYGLPDTARVEIMKQND